MDRTKDTPQTGTDTEAGNDPEARDRARDPEARDRARDPETRGRARDSEATDEHQDGGASGERRGRRGGKGARKQGSGSKEPPPVVEVRPVATPARMQRRHWGLLLAFIVLVLVPFGAVVFYLWSFAEDQYASTTGFTVRQEETESASQLMGGLADFMGGGGGSTDTDVLYEFIQSQEIVERVDEQVDLAAHYGQNWPDDPAFAIWPGASVEDLLWYWRRVVRISYDQNSGLIDVEVRAFDPETARQIARLIVDESQVMINALNEAAREETMAQAARDLDEAGERLREVRQQLTDFRVRTQIIDPEADMQARMGVLDNLQQQLAEALIDYDLLLQSTDEDDPRSRQSRRRIEVIRERIRQERENFASGDVTVAGTDYPTLLSDYESLRTDREFAEEAYRAALTALDSARSNAQRQSRYLATHINPTLPQTAGYPQRPVLAGLAGLFLLMIWAIGALVYYSLRDRE